MSGQGHLNGDLGCFHVAYLANHHHIGVVAQHRAQTAGEGKPHGRVDLDLRDAFELIFDRVFDGDDLSFTRVDLRKAGIEGRRFAASRRAGEKDDPVGFLKQALKDFPFMPGKPQFFEAKKPGGIQDP